MLTIYRSNRVEELARLLGDLLAVPLGDALRSEVIVVQSLGMRRWLSFQIAARFGVAMNCEFPFFAEFGQRVFKSAFAGEAAGKSFSREALPWRVLGAMERLWERAELEPLRRYVGADAASELKRFEVARQIAGVFDRYMAFKPELPLEWERTREGGWQGLLWRDLIAERAEVHPPALLTRLLEQIERGETSLPNLPERVSVFGVASLPPFYLRLLDAVAKCTAVHFFLFEPTDQYWGDLKSPRDQRRYLRRHARPGQTAADLHLEVGHELLASWGKAGQDFTNEVQDLNPHTFREEFRPPEETTLLRQLQSGIFHLRSTADPTQNQEPRTKNQELPDPSLQIHCCHSPMRELEVLYDSLLDLFERLPGLTPKDILVTMPDVGTHAPFIEAVFGAPEDERMRIPYTIADRSASARSAVARTFLKMLELPGRRFTSAEVLALLETAAVRERFGFSEVDLVLVRDAVERNGIRWGIDGRHRAAFGVPAFEQNSWRAGLDRLLLGYALAGDGATLYESILPDAEVEGSLALLAGQLAQFVEGLFELVPGLTAPRSLREWSRSLRRLLDTFFIEETAEGEEVLAVRKALAALGELAEFHAGPVTFAAIRAHLQGVLGEMDSGSGFLAGHVTFCSLKPMRSIPFRVICTLGMNDGAFPRREVPIAFDLLAEPGAGRSRRDEDRQLFLESLLSAREVFYLSYSGLSPKDNSESPPSTVVSELLDHLEALHPAPPREAPAPSAQRAGTQASQPVRSAGFQPAVSDEAKPYARFLTRHRLQPFSPAYFAKSGPLFSYSEENFRASQAGRAAKPPLRTGWIDAPLPELGPEWRAVELRNLIRFFRHPARYFLRERLKLELPEALGEPCDCEPLELDALERWTLANDLAGAVVAGRPLDSALAVVRAAGLAPHGHFGDVQLEVMRQGAAGVGAHLEALALGGRLAPAPLSLTLGEWQLTGTLEGLYESAQLEICGSEPSAKDRLSAWIRHLALGASSSAGPLRTVLVSATGSLEHQPVEDARARLADLLTIYEQGLRSPLPFFPKASYEFSRRTLRPGKRESTDPAKAGRTEYANSEGRDPHNDFCFRHLEEPCGEEWQRLALRIYTPLFNATAEPS